MDDKALTIFVPVWGDHFRHLLRDFAIPAMMFPGNLPSVDVGKIFLDVLAPGQQFQQTAALLEEGLHGLPIELRHIDETDLARGFTNAMHAARIRDTRLLLMMPDTMYAPESIGNIWRYAKGKNVVIGGLYVRNNEDVFKKEFPLWKHWRRHSDYVRNSFAIGALNICDTDQDNCTQVGGVAWTKISEDTRLCLHYLPSPYLSYFTAEDEAWWAAHPEFGNVDHVWPTELMAQRRWRVIGSTDVFFAVELESAARSGGLQPFPGSKGNEYYNHRRPHNDACGSFLIEIHG
jgi:hypothetical protein